MPLGFYDDEDGSLILSKEKFVDVNGVVQESTISHIMSVYDKSDDQQKRVIHFLLKMVEERL